MEYLQGVFNRVAIGVTITGYVVSEKACAC